MPDLGFQPPKEIIPARPVFFIHELDHEVVAKPIDNVNLNKRQHAHVRYYRVYSILDMLVCTVTIVLWLGFLRLGAVLTILADLMLMLLWSRPPRSLFIFHLFLHVVSGLEALLTACALIYPLTILCVESSCASTDVAWSSIVLARFLWDCLFFFWKCGAVGGAYLAWRAKRSYRPDESIDVYTHTAHVFCSVDVAVGVGYFFLFGWWTFYVSLLIVALCSLYIAVRHKVPSRKAYIFHMYCMLFAQIEGGFRAVCLSIGMIVGSVADSSGSLFSSSSVGLQVVGVILAILLGFELLLFLWRLVVMAHVMAAVIHLKGKQEYTQNPLEYFVAEPKVCFGTLWSFITEKFRYRTPGGANPTVAPAP